MNKETSYVIIHYKFYIKLREENVKKMGIVLIIVYLILTTSGLVLMKLGGNAGTVSIKEGTIGLSMHWISAIGFVCYLGSFLLFTKIIVMFDLSYIFPIITGIVQIISLIASKVVFKENISAQAIARNKFDNYWNYHYEH